MNWIPGRLFSWNLLEFVSIFAILKSLPYSENAVKAQIWIAITVYVLVAIAQKRLNLDVSLYTFLQVLSVSQFEKVPILQLLTHGDYKNNETQNHKRLNLFELQPDTSALLHFFSQTAGAQHMPAPELSFRFPRRGRPESPRLGHITEKMRFRHCAALGRNDRCRYLQRPGLLSKRGNQSTKKLNSAKIRNCNNTTRENKWQVVFSSTQRIFPELTVSQALPCHSGRCEAKYRDFPGSNTC